MTVQEARFGSTKLVALEQLLDEGIRRPPHVCLNRIGRESSDLLAEELCTLWPFDERSVSRNGTRPRACREDFVEPQLSVGRSYPTDWFSTGSALRRRIK